MLGAIIGDIVGSPYEFGSDKRTDFALFQPACRATDDSMMTIAVGLGLLDADLSQEYSVKRSLTYWMRRIGREYPDAGYGRMFYAWLMDDRAVPYGGYTNGSAMRESSVAYAAEDLSHCLTLARWSAELTHSHPDGIAGAQAVASALFLARMGESKQQIEAYIEENFYPLDFTLRDIRPHYCHDMTCRGSVPQAIRCFLESTDFESALRLAVSLGGDCDTQAAMAGAIAQAYYGIPEHIVDAALSYLDDTQREYLSLLTENL